MVDLVHKGAEAHTVAEEDELVLVLRALLAHPREELDGGSPLRVRQLRLARERVQVRDEPGDELERAGVVAERLVKLLDAARSCMVSEPGIRARWWRMRRTDQ